MGVLSKDQTILFQSTPPGEVATFTSGAKVAVTKVSIHATG